MLAWYGLLTVLLLSGCRPAADSDPANPIQEATVSLQGATVYGQARLSEAFLDGALEMLRQGEPLLAVYRFDFFTPRSLLPDKELAEVTLRRRLRLHLITEQFELQDISREQTLYSDDPEEALLFLGAPRVILLNGALGAEQPVPLPERGRRHVLEVRFRLQREGVSSMFRILTSLFTFWKPSDYLRTSDHRQP